MWSHAFADFVCFFMQARVSAKPLNKEKEAMSAKGWTIAKCVLASLPLVPIAFFNAAIRETTYINWIGDFAAHQVAVFTGIFFFALYVGWVTKQWRTTSLKQALLIGAEWVAFAIVFEFSWGHLGEGLAWETMLNEYNVFTWHLWPLVLVWIAVAPTVFHLVRTDKTSNSTIGQAS
jgi:hypothetical protein